VSKRARRNTPVKPPVKGRIIEPPKPVPKPVPRDPATVRGLRSGVYCPDCRTELLSQDLTILACPGCGNGFWQRGGEIIREGEMEAIATPDTHVPKAQAKIRKRRDD